MNIQQLHGTTFFVKHWLKIGQCPSLFTSAFLSVRSAVSSDQNTWFRPTSCTTAAAAASRQILSCDLPPLALFRKKSMALHQVQYVMEGISLLRWTRSNGQLTGNTVARTSATNLLFDSEGFREGIHMIPPPDLQRVCICVMQTLFSLTRGRRWLAEQVVGVEGWGSLCPRFPAYPQGAQGYGSGDLLRCTGKTRDKKRSRVVVYQVVVCGSNNSDC